MLLLNVCKEFSEYPALRYCEHSKNSGEEFYHKILNEKFYEAYVNKRELVINLDYTSGYASSFLDECFGNLVYDFTLEKVKLFVSIISNDEPHWKKIIENEIYVEWEKRRLKEKSPKVTILHKPWYKLIDNQLICKIWENPK